MRRFFARKLNIVLALIVVFANIGAGYLLTSPVLACSLTSGTNDTNTWGGWAYSPSSWPGGENGVKADLWNYNPAPVYEASWFWVMLTLHDPNDTTHYDQVGWVKYSGDSQEVVFSQYNDGNGRFTYYYHSSTQTWTTSKTGADSPSSSVEYKATWFDNSGNHQIQNVYNGGTSQNLTVGFSPDDYQVYGEASNFATASPTNHGDHTPGDTTNKIHADSIQFFNPSNSTWQDDAGHTLFTTGNFSADTSGVTGVGFRIWDNRCSN